VEKGKVADVVDDHRTAVAARRRPAVNSGGKHEVVQDELASAIEEIQQARLAVRAVEDVVLVDLNHGQPTALGGQGVTRPGGLLFPGEQVLADCLPLGWRNDRRKIHA
jgi:hypothetical protein